MTGWKNTTAGVMVCVLAIAAAGVPRANQAMAANAPTTASSQPATVPAACWTYQDLLDKKIPQQTYEIAKQHPRLLITPQNKADIIDKIKAAPKVWEAVIKDAEKEDASVGIIACAAIYQLGLADGFKYGLTREEYGKRGIKLLLENAKPKKPSAFKYVALPCGYDWLYDAMTAEERKTVAGYLTTAAAEMKEGNCTIHGAKMMLGLAYYGDGVDDAAAKAIVEDEWKEWWDPQGKTKNLVSFLLYSEDGGNPDGYMHCRANLMPVMAAWKSATGQNLFATLGGLRQLPYYVLARTVPSPVYKDLPLQAGQVGPIVDGPKVCVMATGYLRDVDPRGAALARWWVDHWPRAFEQQCIAGVAEEKVFLAFLIGDPRVKGQSPKESGVPTSLVFHGGTNASFVRSAWDDPDATTVGFAARRYPSLRMTPTYNNFVLWKNQAPLLLYRGKLAHHFYSGRDRAVDTGALLYKGDDRVQDKMGGSTAPFGARAVGRETGMRLADASEAGVFDFARGDFRGYEGVSKCERTVVYLHPTGADKVDHVLVLDRYKVEDKELTPHVVYQMVFEPTVGKDWTAATEGTKVRDGHWRIEDAPCITVTHEYAPPNPPNAPKSHARAFMKVLSPEGFAIIKTGGEQHFMDNLDGTPGTANENYVHFSKVAAPEQIDLGGYWRFHLVPTKPAPEYSFLVAMEVTDSKQAKPVGPMERLPSQEFLAARVGPNLVLLSSGGNAVEAGSVKITTGGLKRIVLADLTADAQYTVTLGGKEIAAGKTTAAGTLLIQKADWPAGETLEVRRASEAKAR